MREIIVSVRSRSLTFLYTGLKYHSFPYIEIDCPHPFDCIHQVHVNKVLLDSLLSNRNNVEPVLNDQISKATAIAPLSILQHHGSNDCATPPIDHQQDPLLIESPSQASSPDKLKGISGAPRAIGDAHQPQSFDLA